MTGAESRLAELGYTLPAPPEPIGNYLSACRSGNIMWMAGVGSRRADGSRISGKVGTDLTVEQGYEAARWCAGTVWGLAETGASGPTGNRYGDSSGHACFAVVGPVEKAITLETGDTDREKNMWVFAKAALDLLIECLNESR